MKMKQFSRLSKEVFAQYVNGCGFQITKPGPLHAPTVSVSVKRDKNLDIIMECVLENGAVSTYAAPRPGEVTMMAGTAEMKSGQMTATATGISPLGTRPQWNEEAGVYAMVERSAINMLEIDLHWHDPQAYLVEWFLIRPHWVFWPESSTTSTLLKHNVVMGANSGGLEIKVETTAAWGTLLDMVTLDIEGHRIYLREVHKRRSSKGRSRCMLVYCDETTAEFRRKVQECISLALGIHLVYLGHTGFSETWDAPGFRAVRGYSINKRVFQLPPQPPSPLSITSYNLLDSRRFNQHVNALCVNYDKLHLNHLSWAYWHAMCAPAHIGAAHYGAVIEALRDSYTDSNPQMAGGRVITDRGVWARVATGLNAVLDSAALGEETLRIMRNKVSNLNMLPAGRHMDLLCQQIGITLGDAEKAAWDRRNDAAHGTRIGSDEYVRVIRDIKLLNIMLNRMLLAMTNASDTYIDYYSTGHPVRKLAEPVPG